MRWSISLLWLVPAALAGPVDFGREELLKAIASRNFGAKSLPFEAEVSMKERPEAFQIAPGRISGGDVRGLMYGLLEAAGQVRATGKLTPARGEAAASVRGVRLLLNNEEWEQRNFHSRPFWVSYFQLLARSRLNRLHLAFAVRPDHWVPPYPHLFSLPMFAGVEVDGLTLFDRGRNMDTLRMITQLSVEYAVDFTFGVWSHIPSAKIRGLAPDLIPPYMRSALVHLLAACPGIRAVYFHVTPQHAALADDVAAAAVQEAGRLVTLELPLGTEVKRGGITVRFIQELPEGVPHPPLDQITMRGPQVLRAVSTGKWINPDFIRKVIYASQLGNIPGFEVIAPAQSYAFYTGWGRLGYNPAMEDPVEIPTGVAAAARAIEDWAAAESKPPSLDLVQRLQNSALEMEQAADEDPALPAMARLTRYRARMLWGDWVAAYYQENKHDSAFHAARNEYREALALAEALKLPLDDVQRRIASLHEPRERSPGAIPWTLPPPRPAMTHQAPKVAFQGQPLTLLIQVAPVGGVSTIRLHYRHLSSAAGFKTLEANARQPRFTIPATDLNQLGPLIYYFEVGPWRMPEVAAQLQVYVTDIKAAPAALP